MAAGAFFAAARTLSTAAFLAGAGAAFSSFFGAAGAFWAAGFPLLLHFAIQLRASCTFSGVPEAAAAFGAAAFGAAGFGAAGFFLAAGFGAAGFPAAGFLFLQFAIQARTPPLPFASFALCFAIHARRSPRRSSMVP